MVSERDVVLTDGRTVKVYDSGNAASGALALVWHHGSPQTGAPLEPLLTGAASRGIRLLSYGRPSYGGSSPHPGRDVASAGRDVVQVADALGIGRFATMGASGGGPHALACAAAAPDRVIGVACLAGLAPYTEDFDSFGGMVSPGGLRSGLQGRAARERYAESEEFDENSFTATDWAALNDSWSSLAADAGRAAAQGAAGLIDDDLAFAAPWGFDVGQLVAPVLVVQGGQDRVVPPAHADWLIRNCQRSELWLRPADGHVSILDACPLAMDWLLARESHR
ncbi:MAG: alpha/beta hydrolase [Frankiales bacterium]|nr:alpha/beta hydrolase [Frankiales bacterium]